MNTNTIERTGFNALAIVHPQHVETLRAHNAEQREGAIVTVTVDRSTSTGSFYTGIRGGDTVAVSGHSTYQGRVTSRTVTVIAGNAAHLSVNTGMALTSVAPSEWTYEQAIAAKRQAEQGAADKMEQALTSATGWGRYDFVAEDGQERAMEALAEAKALRHYAFAAGILGEYIDGIAREDGYHKGAFTR